MTTSGNAKFFTQTDGLGVCLLEESAFPMVCVSGKSLMLVEEHLNQFCIRGTDMPFVSPFFNCTL